MTLTNQTRGQRVLAARKSLGWSQRELATYLEFTHAQLSYAENDHARVSPVYWRVLMDFCDKVDSRLIRAEDKPQPKSEGTTP